MSKQQIYLPIEIDVGGDKCGKCDHKKVNYRGFDGERYKCGIFPQYIGRGKRCQSCLDAERDANKRDKVIRGLIELIREYDNMLISNQEPLSTQRRLGMSRDTVTLRDIEELDKEVAKDKTIGHWKRAVKAFATKHGLTDMEAINIANKRF